MKAKRWYSGITEQRTAAMKRKRDARALLSKGEEHGRGAMYLAGYAIECKVKAIAMEAYRCWTLEALKSQRGLTDQDIYTHRLEGLILRIMPQGSLDRLKQGSAGRAFVTHVNTWRPSWRCDPTDVARSKAEAFLDAVDEVYTWLEMNR